MKKTNVLVLVLLTLCSVVSIDIGVANAAGCIKGAVAGGVVGHVAGHHAVAGAVAGCVIGHHVAKKQQQEKKNAGRQDAQQPQSAPVR